MGRGTWYYSLGVSSIVDAFVSFGVLSWHGARVGVRTYLLDGAIDGGEANGIIRDPNTRSNADLRRLVSFDVFGKARVVGRIIEATSGAKRKLSRCGRNQMGNEPTLALPEGADDFIVYYDARSKELEACSDKEEVTVLWAITGEVELNGSNLVQETTNKIVVMEGRRSHLGEV
ncbi:hypothetical protein Tco_1375765 [Tanacetum coccineum]